MSFKEKLVRYGTVGSATAMTTIVTIAQTHASGLIDVVNNTASGATATAGAVAEGPAGTIVYTIMGIQLLITVITMIYALKRSKN